MRIVLGVAGGIAAYKACHVVRELRERGHTVRVVPTRAALEFVGAATWEALSGQPVATDVFTRVDEVEHVRIGQDAELVVIAPATADLLARLRAGIADDLLTATVLTTTAPVVAAPAMHTEMWQNPATVDNVSTLRSRGMHVIDPASGRLTGADSGPGRLPEPGDIVAAALAIHAESTSVKESTAVEGASGEESGTALAGRNVLVTAGGTREPLDPVRFLGNRSSGKQGAALAAAAARSGARVRLIAANVAAEVIAELPGTVTIEHVETTAELQAAAEAAQPDSDVVIMCAAVSDYRPAEVAAHKMKKDGDAGLRLELVQNPDILAGLVRTRTPGQLIVGFAAETGSPDAGIEELARAKLLRKGCDLLVLNDVSAGQAFGTESNSVILYARTGDTVTEVARASGTKAEVSQKVISGLVSVLDR
ncbi:bifunctional phosphopantothenoylcysteine decarboxylase/phosphopantothenate--cysteine ligase CoaBC [Brevibacterium sp. R8603A2]|uniref:bifunctional phosphopantothenoylcysteine decarboxylase/phosphopantothenate--cysteine ligase CoaBC n=1 Tax=unclassified Brevibacterium TaxID=2614124 RepID=UPI001FF89ADD|nr:bifunctional phosphopantothenoylcysteine decarboxylase/phosphopantothenate--cysteine ligase CoaBC [uncultured Brevibacterium sp.]MCK1802542.1 bifunctional phosphopantothenoylcysteine decarboxylase/phosphopantothenate--cysteine ligase CoaBC [Brevibacterium sp. R8603A2]